MLRMNDEEVRSLILCRVMAACESCNSHHISHCEGQIRALIMVLTGEAPLNPGGDTASVLEAAGIPYEKNEDGSIAFVESWLLDHGFEIRRGTTPDQDKPYHPRFSRSW